MSLRVLSLPLPGTLQDGGRPGYRRHGVPEGGVFDSASCSVANSLLGNSVATASLEITLAGGEFLAESPVQVAVVGAQAEVFRNDEPEELWSVISLAEGDVLRLGPCADGARSYLCVAGGFGGPKTLGSVSGVQVVRRSVLEVGPSESVALRRAHLGEPISLGDAPLRVVPGPQRDLYDADTLAGEFRVSNYSNRVGIRLEGSPIEGGGELPSEPICVGAIQVTAGGQLVVIGPDGPTLGGYPKIAVVISADHSRLGQLAPGRSIQFECVDHDTARALDDEESRRLSRICGLFARNGP